MTFDTLLVANRGEIAVRILRTARELGLRTVAVYSEADAGAAHTHLADEAVLLGPAPAAQSYLRADRIVEAALATGAGAIHPGYGFLSENAGFARAAEAAGIAFVGPRPEHLELFGSKHTARDAARAVGVPMLAGTGLLGTLDEALAAAETIGWPVMLKATAGGGGIGMRACHGPDELTDAWEAVRRVAGASFGTAGVFLERLITAARHVEVQAFGDGLGTVVTLGDRDCSLQRRNQKVCEEAPAPALPDHVRSTIATAAHDLCASVAYRSAGTVEYVYDAEREEVAFLEVNTRLQVEHPVTEAVYGVDLVAWMLRLAQGDTSVVGTPLVARGHAVEARVYAENPDHDHVPSAGTVTSVRTPAGVRVDTWVEAGSEVSTHYDPLLAKVVVAGDDRAAAWAALGEALAGTRVDGVATNVGLLRSIARDGDVLAATHTTATLAHVRDASPRVQVLRAGMLTTVQDWPGRTGYWHVGIPPSGPMDDLSFRLGNRALGNAEGAPGLECTMTGPSLRFATPATVLVAGAPTPVTLDGEPVAQWEPVEVPAGGVLDVGTATAGMRAYVLVRGGLDVPEVLGSAATFDLGEIGGATGRPLRPGDLLALGTPDAAAPAPAGVPADGRPAVTDAWQIGALEGPHAAPEFFTPDDVTAFYAARWSVHFNSARTGVRLVGPKPVWARPDGGEAGLHPSNIHDTPYAVGAVDYTGDVPILLGPDGPSLGGFTCPATVAVGQLWKLGQLRPGDTVQFVPVDEPGAEVLRQAPLTVPVSSRAAHHDGGVLGRLDASTDRPAVTYRRSGDDNLLIEYGPMQLDLATRLRVHALAERIAADGRAGIVDLTPGIRSLQVHLDPDVLPLRTMLDLVQEAEDELPPTSDLVVPSRTVHLPLSWDDPATREATERYMAGVRDDAPWCPWNIEFIRRINGLGSVDDVHRTVFDAEYLVLGLGDVYLGAPVATPLDPRHRLVTTKYNPARTWTPQNAVGIGGAYLCIYGMEGPGGYQFVGRTVQVWDTHRQRGPFEPGTPWLLRFFDRIRWFPVEADELLDMRADMAAGRLDVRIDEGEFVLADHERFLRDEAGSIAEFQARQSAAFADERAAWEAAGEFDPRPEPALAVAPQAAALPPGCASVDAPFVGTVFRVDVAPGDRVEAGQVLLALEAMKMEAPVTARAAGVVVDVAVAPGDQVGPGQALVVVREEVAA
ncbi:urea carboxylase [Cellulomonas cellasea]|uniref:Urea amidolyase n=2 Tax=Cellulomonas cellasea TaxID=43670 RepID=A0A0A0B7P7_9CELL|nr:urea carboxylase [Cellulomonas cellasea]KGM02192.1 urea amidolyase [Cellulomonas cellasea DSM 20118]GEA88954.1 urea carboxylase [Cellulomonas cellasea]